MNYVRDILVWLALPQKRPSPGRLVTGSVLCMHSPAIAYPVHTHLTLHHCQSGDLMPCIDVHGQPHPTGGCNA